MKTDQELINAAAKGDIDAFETLYRRYRDWTYNLARRFTADNSLAQDVVQEVFTYLVKKITTLKLTARLTTFLYPAVRNYSLTAIQKKKRFISPEDSFDELPAQAESPDPNLEDLASVLKILTQNQRQIILMRYVDDMTISEISEALNLPVGTIKSRLHHALEKLRKDPRTKQYFLD